MKVRNGFVSNSSSSSFIIQKQGRYSDTVSIAHNMLNDYFVEYSNYFGDHPKKEFMLNELKQLKQNGDNNIPIMFCSTNYDTYILDLGDDYVYIKTCHNVYWDALTLAVKELPLIIEEKYGKTIDFQGYDSVYFHDQYYEYVSDDSDEMVKSDDCMIDIKYYKIDSGFFIQKLPAYKSCETCYQELYIINGKELCLHCNHKSIDRGLKVTKLKKLLK